MTTLGMDYFDDLYATSADPWGFTTRWYEARKYALSLALLPAERYRDAFEPGCSIGVLTELLARRCDRLLSCDGAAAAVRAATARTAQLPHVRVARAVIPDDWPAGEFDLIVFSEILYYFAGDDLARVLSLGVSALRPGGTLLAVHWRHPVADYPRSGDEVHQALAGQGGLARLVEHREPDLLAEVYIRGDGEPLSVAQATGLA
ncbi:MAG TPA: SAM-dependent methyltransferase [Streptosporangiaceae bacterium]|jgi:SAM-dependent methyltransferase